MALWLIISVQRRETRETPPHRSSGTAHGAAGRWRSRRGPGGALSGRSRCPGTSPRSALWEGEGGGWPRLERCTVWDLIITDRGGGIQTPIRVVVRKCTHQSNGWIAIALLTQTQKLTESDHCMYQSGLQGRGLHPILCLGGKRPGRRGRDRQEKQGGEVVRITLCG